MHWCNFSVQSLFKEMQLPQHRDIKHACKQRSLANKKLNSKDVLSFSENRCQPQ